MGERRLFAEQAQQAREGVARQIRSWYSPDAEFLPKPVPTPGLLPASTAPGADAATVS